jgi:hypothetical protein
MRRLSAPGQPPQRRIRERRAHAVALLVILVSLARDEHEIAGRGARDRAADRGAAIELDDEIASACSLDAGDHCRSDRAGVFTARIVVGDHDAIAARRRDAPHFRALAGIAIAPAAEYADELVALRDGRAQCIEHLLQRVGRVRVIDHDEGLRSAADSLHPSRRRRHSLERRERVGETNAARQQHAEYAERVRCVERAGQPQRDVGTPARGRDRQLHSFRLRLEASRDDVAAGDPVGQHFPAPRAHFRRERAGRTDRRD